MGDSWVGGDIGGLHTMGTTYTNAKKKLDDVVTPLSKSVDKLVGDASWTGDAAEEFRGRWSEDAITAGAFAELVSQAGGIISGLAGALSTCEKSLHNAEDIAVRKGVQMKDKGVPAEMVTSDPPSADEKKAVAALNDYVTARKEILHTAQHARLEAADKLRGLYKQVTDPVSPGDKLTLADALRGLYAYDAEDARAGGKKAREKLDDAKKQENLAKKELRAERRAFQKAGKKLPKDLPAKSAYRDAVSNVEKLEDDIARADHGSTKLPYDRALNYKLADVADALKAGRALEDVPEFLKEIPVLDVAAAGTCGILEAKDDHDKGWSWQHSVVVDEGANLGGLAVGAGAAALLPEAAPAVAVAAVGVGVAVVGTSAIDHAVHEHWREDFHEHGFWGGLGVGTGHVASETGDDMKRLGGDVWHGIKSIF